MPSKLRPVAIDSASATSKLVLPTPPLATVAEPNLRIRCRPYSHSLLGMSFGSRRMNGVATIAGVFLASAGSTSSSPSSPGDSEFIHSTYSSCQLGFVSLA